MPKVSDRAMAEIKISTDNTLGGKKVDAVGQYVQKRNCLC